MAMLRAFFLLCLLALAGCSTEPEPIQVEAEGAPALWQITGEKGKVWLFGTVHLLPPDTDWQSLALQQDGCSADSDYGG